MERDYSVVHWLIKIRVVREMKVMNEDFASKVRGYTLPRRHLGLRASCSEVKKSERSSPSGSLLSLSLSVHLLSKDE